jgi:hypothetical protein
LRALGAGIEFLRRGHTAGEACVAQRWSTQPERELYAELARLPLEDPDLRSRAST